jgi:ribonuclease BN (tRNA processing enzyme)
MRSVAYLTDHEPFERFMAQIGRRSAEDVAYARDQDQHLVDFIDGADGLILESQYDAAEYTTRAGWGHGCVDDAVAIALRSRAKRLFLFHHDPNHDDDFMTRLTVHGRELVKKAGAALFVEAARERSECAIGTDAADTRAIQEA